MPTMAVMNEQFVLSRKDVGDDSPEDWLDTGPSRRGAFSAMSPREALAAGAVFESVRGEPTHTILVLRSDEYKIGRVLLRQRDDGNFRIMHIGDAGKRNAGTGPRYQRLIVSEIAEDSRVDKP